MFFLDKIKTYVIPYADILAWCLMPNHFHLMVYVREVELPVLTHSQGFTNSEALTSSALTSTSQATRSEALIGQVPTSPKLRTFNDSIGIMLRSYTRAINKQEGFTGSLFRKETKAECINCPKGIAPAFINDEGLAKINFIDPLKQYPQVCFNYIHQNPIKAGLVKNALEWEFSSAKDYAGIRNSKIVNKTLAAKYVSIIAFNSNLSKI